MLSSYLASTLNDGVTWVPDLVVYVSVLLSGAAIVGRLNIASNAVAKTLFLALSVVWLNLVIINFNPLIVSWNATDK